MMVKTMFLEKLVQPGSGEAGKFDHDFFDVSRGDAHQFLQIVLLRHISKIMHAGKIFGHEAQADIRFRRGIVTFDAQGRLDGLDANIVGQVPAEKGSLISGGSKSPVECIEQFPYIPGPVIDGQCLKKLRGKSPLFPLRHTSRFWPCDS